MPEQIILNFDANEFEGYETTQEFFNYLARSVHDSTGRRVKQEIQAMEMDLSPSQYNQKLNCTNNTKLTLDDVDKHTDLYGDTRWIEFAFYKHVICKKKDKAQIKSMIADLQRQLDDA